MDRNTGLKIMAACRRWACVLLLPFAMQAAEADQYYVGSLNSGQPSILSTYDSGTNNEIAAVELPEVIVGLTVSPDGQSVYAATYAGVSKIAASAPGSVVASTAIRGFSWNSVALAVSPDNNTVYVSSADGSLYLIGAASHTITQTYTVSDSSGLGVAVSPDGRKLYVATSLGVAVVNTATGAVSTNVVTAAAPRSLALTPDGRSLYVPVGAGTSIQVIDTATLAATTISNPAFQGVGHVALLPNGTAFYAADLAPASGSTNLYKVGLPSNTLLATTALLNYGGTGYALAILPDSSRAYVGQGNGSNFLAVDTATNATTTVTSNYGPVYYIATQPVAATAHTVKLYLHGNDIPGTAGGFTMNQTAPATGTSVTLSLLSAPAWFSDPVFNGSFASGTAFQVDFPCSLGLGALVTYSLARTNVTGGAATPIGSTTQLLNACVGTTHSVTIPVTGPVVFSNQRLKLTISSLLGLLLTMPLGSGTDLQGTLYTGTP